MVQDVSREPMDMESRALWQVQYTPKKFKFKSRPMSVTCSLIDSTIDGLADLPTPLLQPNLICICQSQALRQSPAVVTGSGVRRVLELRLCLDLKVTLDCVKGTESSS
jgi:hypothetical protein